MTARRLRPQRELPRISAQELDDLAAMVQAQLDASALPSVEPLADDTPERLGCEGSEPARCVNVVRALKQDDAQQTHDQQDQQTPAHLGTLTLTPQPGELCGDDHTEGRKGGAGPHVIEEEDAATQQYSQDNLQRPRQTHDQSIEIDAAAGGTE